jgi:hypothetical protein
MPRICRMCGCTDEDPCFNESVGAFAPLDGEYPDETCHWVEKDLCSFCSAEQILKDEQQLVQLYSEADLKRFTR